MIGGRESTKGKLLTHTTRKRKLDTCVEVDILFLILLYTQHSIVYIWNFLALNKF